MAPYGNWLAIHNNRLQEEHTSNKGIYRMKPPSPDKTTTHIQVVVAKGGLARCKNQTMH